MRVRVAASEGHSGPHSAPWNVLAATAGDGVTAYSTMVALYPTREQAAAISAATGVAEDQLHLTLCYLGETTVPLEQVSAALAKVAAGHAPLTGEIAGAGAFADNGKGHPHILLPSVPGLVELRVEVTQALAEAGIDYSRNYGYTAHLTTGYSETYAPSMEGVGLALSFRDLWVVRGDREYVPLAFTGATPVTAAGNLTSARKRRAMPNLAVAGPVANHHNRVLDAAYTRAETLEDKLTGLLTPLLEKAGADAASRFRRIVHLVASVRAAGQQPPPGWTLPAGDELVDVKKLTGKLAAVTDPVAEQVVRVVVEATLKGHSLQAAGTTPPPAPGLSFDATNPFVSKVLQQTGSQITNIADTTRAHVMRTVRTGYKNGDSIDQVAKNIEARMREAAPARARLIARTELAGAVNGGSLAATQIVSDALSIGFLKQWLTAAGAQFPRHEMYDGLGGQTTVLEGLFQVGADELEYPGDPAGSPEEVCNCRCTIVYMETGGGVVAEGDADMGLSAEDVIAEAEGEAAADEITPEEITSIKSYTNNAYESVNAALREDAFMEPFDQKIVDNIDSAFAKTKPLEGNEHSNLYRSIHKDAPVVFGTDDPTTLVGKVFTDRAFMSASYDDAALDTTTKDAAVIKIRAGAGSKVLDLNEIGASYVKSEEEALLPRDSSLRITSAQRDEFGVWNIEADLVPPVGAPPAPVAVPEAVSPAARMAVKDLDLPSEWPMDTPRPYDHITEKTLGSQISKYRVNLRKLAGKEARGEALTAKEQLARNDQEGKLRALLEEKEFRSGEPQRQYAHWTDERINDMLGNLRVAMDLPDAIGARRAALRAELSKLTGEQAYRRAHPKAALNEASLRVLHKQQAAEMAAAPNDRVQQLRDAHTQFQAEAVRLGSFVGHEEMAGIEQRVASAGFQVRREMIARMQEQVRPFGLSPVAHQRQVLSEVLADIRPMGLASPTDQMFKKSTGDAAAFAEVRKAAAFFPRDWLDAAASSKVTFERAKRGFFIGDDSRYLDKSGQMKIRSEGRLAVSAGQNSVAGDSPLFGAAVHELAHVMEWKVKGLARLESAFYRRRTLGEELRYLPGHGKNVAQADREFTREDQFANPYMGRDYSGHTGYLESRMEAGTSGEFERSDYYEIVTTAMESFTTGRYGIMEADTDMTNFVLGMLALL